MSSIVMPQQEPAVRSRLYRAVLPVGDLCLRFSRRHVVDAQPIGPAWYARLSAGLSACLAGIDFLLPARLKQAGFSNN